ncbi:M23 family metallopeptidase [Portibacter marinus]|uniref:M23 family metallopeptidase n=1 Tax=Portibacter marinus TaxID=2898660 RepID=UPI0029E80E01|nr:M23 family metallopeptidase [Portibacter marinus]
MKREKYVYNPNTLTYEKHQLGTKEIIKRSIGITSGVILTSILLCAFAYYYLPSPKERAQKRELDQLSMQYELLTNEMNSMAQELGKVQEKDANIHRVILGMDPIDENVWEGGIGGSEKYDYITNYSNTGKIIKQSLSKLDKLKLQFEIQKRSLDTLEMLADSRKEKLASIPSIKPVRADHLKRNILKLSGYGYRIHPIHNVKKFHKGIDFTAPKGTAIISSGDGKVIRVEEKKRGYGKNIIIDHGYGYTTLYGHLSEIDVEVGEKVTRGQVIGKIGSTGTSTAPHLHYEVRINGNAVNPIDYCMDGLTPEEYQILVHRAAEENQSFD